MNKTCVIVLGMHRSGTSATARVLNLLGCSLPHTLMPARGGNDAGHWESDAICAFNDDLLAAQGTAWDDWLPINPLWRAQPRYEADLAGAVDLLGREFGDSPLFVMKDPRQCRMIAFWAEAVERFGAAPRFVMPLRNPWEVASSLERRNGMDARYALLLWLRHALDAERGTRGLARSFFTYPALLGDWRAVVGKLARELDIAFPNSVADVADEVDTFLTSELRHHSGDDLQLLDDPALSGWIRSVYAILLGWAGQGESEGDFARLDRIAAIIDEAAPAFSGLLLAGHRQQSREDAHDEQERDGVVLIESESAKLRGELEQQRQMVASQLAGLAALQSQLTSSAQRVAEVEAQMHDAVERENRNWLERCEFESQLVEANRQLLDMESTLNRLRNDSQGQMDWLGAELKRQSSEARAQAEAFEREKAALEERFEQQAAEREQEAQACQAEMARRFEAQQADMARQFEAQQADMARQFEAQQADMAAQIEQAQAQANQLAHRLAEMESQLVQRREELEQAWADVRQAGEEKLALEARLAAEGDRSAALEGRLAESEAWVFRLSGERTEGERQVQSLSRQLENARRQLAESEALAGRLGAALESRPAVSAAPEPELVEQAVAKALEHQAEELREAMQAEFARREAELAAGAAKREAELADRLAERERRLASLEEGSKAAERLAQSRQQEIADLRRKMAEQDDRINEAGAARMQAERGLNERFSELATLTGLLRQQNSATKASMDKAEWLRRVQAVLTNHSKWDSLLPANRVRQRHYEQLQAKGLFDPDGYLAQYPDVAAAGLDPLRHYILHGMEEGRSQGF